ncbi:MAG: hypothetical protein GY950_14985 [bacterium]|nr:hypothetical protein [bacterium]
MKRITTIGLTFFLGIFFMVVFNVNSVYAETVKIKVPKALVVSAFNLALNGMEVKIDNYGSKSATSWLSQQSYVRLPDGSKKSFSIPEHTTSIKIRKWRHYVEEFNTSSMNVVADEGINLTLKLGFESQGEEVKGKCLRRKINGSWTEASVNIERDFHLNNSLLDVRVTLTPHLGSISFKNPKASFKTDVHIPNRLCKLFGSICSIIENKIYKGIRDGVENSIESALNKSSVRNSVANASKDKIKGLIDPKWSITKIESAGSDYQFTVQRPDTIDQNSVKIKSFYVIQKKATIVCPGKVKFKARISTSTKMKGTVYLVNENGKKTRSLPWRMGKKGSATSTLSRTWNANDFKAHNGWSRLVIKWKGTDGKSYQKKSVRKYFTRTCSKSATDKIKH